MDNGFHYSNGSGRPRAPIEREDKLIIRVVVTGPDSSPTGPFPHICVKHDRRRTLKERTSQNNHRSVWRCSEYCGDPAFHVERLTRPQQDVVIWSAIIFESHSWHSIAVRRYHSCHNSCRYSSNLLINKVYNIPNYPPFFKFSEMGVLLLAFFN
ncbi:hypothetical protein TNCV_1887041 [Trichonephila clavipes]|nr:hypothetical protein TNCV_1887041 [Trichonephila clavipes]